GASPVGANVITTNPINGLSFGFARTLNNAYLGLYIGGEFVNAEGDTDGGNGTLFGAGNDKKASWATGDWDAKLAFLYGTEALGGIRLDLIIEGDSGTSKYNGETVGVPGTGTGVGNTFAVGGRGTVIAGTWGKDLSETLAAHVKLGFRFADYRLINNEGVSNDKITSYSNAGWILNGGGSSVLNDVSTFNADLVLGGSFGSRSTPETGDVTTVTGNFVLGIDGSLVNIFVPVSGLELGLKPYAALGFYTAPNDTKIGGTNAKGADDTSFEFAVGVDAGLKAQLPGKFNKFSLVTGVGLDIFDWQTASQTKAPAAKDLTTWSITTLGWRVETLGPSGQLGLGLVFDPNQNLSVGLGINALLDGLFVVDLEDMQVTPGAFFTGGTAGGFLTNLFTNSTIDLTVSCKF
ncbi:MAG: hypothetical protein LBF95_05190, partial [Treponema sp.]|nr:hypothetical protein [Treponema sp.]